MAAEDSDNDSVASITDSEEEVVREYEQINCTEFLWDQTLKQHGQPDWNVDILPQLTSCPPSLCKKQKTGGGNQPKIKDKIRN